ncbi:hypothetical protein [Bacillus sp. REN16]|uniref:hypothetical protein n=1 Tax=Bacillus sp. REN16 TaxID=2887296 RepID=UPI001E53AC6E|nr:hypothetical protein [Bacillus sp. REN16]MCC3359265.1 hypothetical protein [Bacillus sp. REN16]
MTSNEIRYEVVWGIKARVRLAEMQPFKINPKLVFRNSKDQLALKPKDKALGFVDNRGFEFDGYYWAYINNVIIVYQVLDEENLVLVDACYSALTGFALKTFFGEHDTDPL